jgi:hypothetical protein
MLAWLMVALAVGAVIWLWRHHAANLEARRFAEFRAAAEGGQWFAVRTGNWENWRYDQRRTVAWARLREQHPANWWDYESADRWEYVEQVETRPYPPPAPAPAPQYGTTPQRPAWSTGTRYDPNTHGHVPGVIPGMTSYPTAPQVQAYNAQGSAAFNAARNANGNAN